MDARWKFPYNKINKKERIVLYGAGKIGSSFKKQIEENGYCEVVAWVDTNYMNIDNTEILSPAIIAKMDYDKILIAIKNETAVSMVINNLRDMGLDCSKVVSYIDSYEVVDEEFRLEKKDFSQEPDLEHLDIAFIVPDPIKGGGGHRNIFRAVRYLTDFGHSITVYIYKPSTDASQTKKNVSEWFYPMDGIKFVCNHGELSYHDAGVATSWETPYVFKNQEDHFRNLFYFVQDFEPYFFAMSSGYFLAENTYKMGYSHICSGPWIDRVLREKYNAESRYFQFPLDTNIYNTKYKRRKENKNILFFAKPEMPRRCFELGIQALATYKEKYPETEIIMFGSTVLSEDMVPFEATIVNYVPTLEGLAEIYANADLGIVFSPTNPSLVPYEMMSCGCPVVDLDIEMAITKYGNDTNNVFLLDPLPDKFAESLNEILNDNVLLEVHRKSGLAWVEKEFPSELEMAKIVEDCIVRKISTGSIYI